MIKYLIFIPFFSAPLATVTKTDSMAGNSNSWASDAGGGTSLSGAWNAADNSTNDISSGSLDIIRTAKNLTNGTPFFEISGTYAQIFSGIQSGATIQNINLSYDWRCKTYTSGVTSQAGPAELRDQAATLIGTFSTSITYTAATAWAQRAGTMITPSNHTGSTFIRLRVTGIPKTANTTGATVTMQLDRMIMTVNYTNPVAKPRTVKLIF